MDKFDVENALKKLAGRSMPELPADFERRVWREIRSRKTLFVRESFWEVLASVLPRLRWSMAAITVAVVVSIGFSLSENMTPYSAAHQSLNLSVFSAKAPTLPSTLLARTP